MKVIAKILRAVGTILLVGMILACAVVVVPKIAGFSVYAVISGSMEPTIPTGSLVFVEKVEPEALLTNDIVAYNSQIAGGGVITHRVVEIKKEERSFITKGDANSSSDVTPVKFEQLVGRVKSYIPGLGKIALVLSEKNGKLIAGGVILVALFLNLLASFFEKTGSGKKTLKKNNPIQESLEENVPEKIDTEENDSIKEVSAQPKKGNKNASILLLLGVGCLLIGAAGFNIYRIFHDYNSSNNLYDELEDDYVTTISKEEELENVPWYEMISVDLASLQEQNSDVKGWIYFENEAISYPILYSGDDDTYLRRTMDKKSATAGSIFIEGMNNPDFEDSHTLIYGHNMRNLSMFGKLKYYKEDPDYYIDHMYFQIIKNDVVYRYQIFAYEDVSEDSFIYAVPYGPTEDFAEFIDRIYGISYRQTGAVATKDDKIITLSTCSTTSGEGRFVVHGVRVDEHTY